MRRRRGRFFLGFPVDSYPAVPYTEMIVREAIRFFPPAPFFARHPTEDVTVGE